MIDWNSEETVVLLNPRVDSKEPLQQLLNIGLKSHFWVGTSGTEGKKWVALSKEALLISAEAVNKHLNVSSKDVWLHVLPDFHVGGLSIYARASLSRSKIIKQASWSVPEFVRDAEKATISALVPTQVHDLVKSAVRAPQSIRAVVVGGGRLPTLLYEKAKKLGWPLLPSYGLTECCSQVATALPGSNELKILPHISCRIREGRLALKSAALLTGYATIGSNFEFHDPKEEGWLQTEDFAELSGGCLIPLGRGTEYTKVSGEGVSIAQLEEKLFSITDHSCALFPVPHERLGHVIGLAVEVGVDFTAIVEAYQCLVAPFERIQKVLPLEKIPRTALGKVQRAKLCALLEELPPQKLVDVH